MVAEPIRVSPHVVDTGARSSGPVRTGWNVVTAPVGLDQLTDVDAPPTVQGVLERQSDQVVRPVSRTDLIADHVNSLTPHPAYDDLPSLTLLFDNGMV